MAIRSFGLVAALATLSRGFLLPPDLSTDAVKSDLDLSTWTLVDPNSQVLLVPCDGCKTSASDDNNLFLNISVGSQPGTLELGGKVFYPPMRFVESLNTETPYVLEVPLDVSLTDIRSDFSAYSENSASVTGWGFASSRSETTESGDEILHGTLDIHMINMDRVHVPSIDLQVLKRPDGEMMILAANAGELAKQPNVDDKEECDGPLCEWRQFLEDKLHGIAASMPKWKGTGKGCQKGKGMKGMDMPHGPKGDHGGHRRPMGEHGHGRPHGFRQGHHHAHHKIHRFMHRVGKFIMAVAIPILVGIAAGVATYAIGMTIGMVIVLVWGRFRRGSRRGYDSVALDEDTAAAKEIEAEVEPRESYESAPPVYEEKETVV